MAFLKTLVGPMVLGSFVIAFGLATGIPVSAVAFVALVGYLIGTFDRW